MSLFNGRDLRGVSNLGASEKGISIRRKLNCDTGGPNCPEYIIKSEGKSQI